MLASADLVQRELVAAGVFHQAEAEIQEFTNCFLFVRACSSITAWILDSLMLDISAMASPSSR